MLRTPVLMLISTLLLGVPGCATTTATGERVAAGLPRAPIPGDVRAQVTDALNGHRPSRVLGRVAAQEVHSPGAAVDELVRQFPQYDDAVECYTEARDHYVISVRLLQAPDHAYRFVVFVPVGGRLFRVYLAAR
jgi:hypothetical protein